MRSLPEIVARNAEQLELPKSRKYRVIAEYYVHAESREDAKQKVIQCKAYEPFHIGVTKGP